MKNSSIKFVNDFLGTLGTETLLRVIGYGTTILLARYLTVADFGSYSLIISILGTLVALTAFGLPQAIIYFIGKKKADTTELLQTIFVFWLLIVLPVIIVLLLLHVFYGSVPIESELLLILVFLYLIKLLDYFLISVVRGVQNFFAFNLKKLADPVLFLLMLFVLIFVRNLDVLYVLQAYLLVSFISTLMLFVYLNRKFKMSFPRHAFQKDLIKDILKFGSKSYLQTLAGQLNYQISIYMIAWLLSDKDVGLYAVAVSFASLLWFLPNTVGTVLLPALSAKQNDQDINQMTLTISRHTFYLSLTGIILVGGLGQLLMPLIYGNAYVAAYLPMLLLLPGILAISLYKILTRNFTSRNQQQITIYASVVSLLVNVLLNLVLVRLWGISGGALSASVSYVLSTVILLHFFLSHSKIPLQNLFIIQRTDFKIYQRLLVSLITRTK